MRSVFSRNDNTVERVGLGVNPHAISCILIKGAAGENSVVAMNYKGGVITWTRAILLANTTIGERVVK